MTCEHRLLRLWKAGTGERVYVCATRNEPLAVTFAKPAATESAGKQAVKRLDEARP